MEPADTPLVDTLDMEILLHRDCHFSALFDEMLDYYKKEGVGSMPDFEIGEIEKLYALEKKLGKDLGPLYLNEASYEIIRSAKDMYAKLREVYEETSPEPGSVLISDLILSEEEYPEQTINAICQEKETLFERMLPLLSSDYFYNPLFPGYGRVPLLAADILQKMNNPAAIPHLFNALSEDNFFTDEAILAALISFGDQAIDFLIPKLNTAPFSNDNERAAIALSSFPENEKIAKVCLDTLEKEDSLAKPMFASYLIFACSALKARADQQRFIKLSKTSELAAELKMEMDIVIKNFDSDK